jgi:hypothetical protein
MPDDKLVVREIEIIRVAAAGEHELWRCQRVPPHYDRVVAAGIVKREYGVDQQP